MICREKQIPKCSLTHASRAQLRLCKCAWAWLINSTLGRDWYLGLQFAHSCAVSLNIGTCRLHAWLILYVCAPNVRSNMDVREGYVCVHLMAITIIHALVYAYTVSLYVPSIMICVSIWSVAKSDSGVQPSSESGKINPTVTLAGWNCKRRENNSWDIARITVTEARASH